MADGVFFFFDRLRNFPVFSATDWRTLWFFYGIDWQILRYFSLAINCRNLRIISLGTITDFRDIFCRQIDHFCDIFPWPNNKFRDIFLRPTYKFSYYCSWNVGTNLGIFFSRMTEEFGDYFPATTWQISRVFFFQEINWQISRYVSVGNW